jgi:dTDP-4-dehydrorhamnose 3,5-epimerase
VKVTATPLEGVVIVEPRFFGDHRGFFMETYHQNRYKEAGIPVSFVQDNISFSVQGTLRGLHYQHPHGQAKLVQVLQGEIYDVAVDIRHGSPDFGCWTGVTLSADNQRQLYIPEGFAHGFCVLSETALFAYKCSDFYAPEAERGICWNDPDLGIEWPVADPVLSDRDRTYHQLKEIAVAHLPTV